MGVTHASLISSRFRDSLELIHQRTFALIVRGASLHDVLDALGDGIDALDPDLISSGLPADADGAWEQPPELSTAATFRCCRNLASCST